jgi:uncharacterized protein YdeI (YjbR/CyaY-like superfamily)
MMKSKTNPKVDGYFSRAKKWKEEMEMLREIVLGCGLTEELKWGKPCYTFEGSNLVLIIGFKDYCALLLCKGALLKDAAGIVVKAGESTQAARQIRFTGAGEIKKLKAVLKAYLEEAIAGEKAGLKVVYKKNPEPVPEELQTKLKEDAALKKAFEALTPGRQRAYILHFAGAKQSATRVSRIEKCRPQILAGKGFNEEYRKK